MGIATTIPRPSCWLPLALLACAPKVHPVQFGVHQASHRDASARIELELDGSFTYWDAVYGPTSGTWLLDGREVVLSAPASLEVEAFGRVSPTAETVPVQVLGMDGRPVGAAVRFLHDGKEEARMPLRNGVARVSRYLPFDTVQVLPASERGRAESGPMVEHEAFHAPYAAYRITLTLGRRFEEERWRVGKERLIQPTTAGGARRVYRWQEPEREIVDQAP